MNKEQFECELRGPITWSDFFDLKKILEETFGEFVVTKELAIFIKGPYDMRVKINTKGSKLVYKKSIGINDYKKEIEVDIPRPEILNMIKILGLTGFNNAVYSYVEKYNAHKGNKSFSVKFGSKIGDFFEIETLLENKDGIQAATIEMQNYAKKVGLILWSNEAYDDLLKHSWKNEKEEFLYDKEKNSFNKIITESFNKINRDNTIFEKTIREILEVTSNDYSDEERKFYNAYGQKIDSEKKIKNKSFTSRVSVIIPTYNSKNTLIGTLQSINNQKLTPEEKSLVEVVIVDDGSTDDTNIEVDKISYNFEIKYIRQNHIGRGNARNLGVTISTGKIIIFLDSDVIIGEDFIREHVLRHEVVEKGVFVSFKENIVLKDSDILGFIKQNNKPNIKNDFRFHKIVDPEWLRIHRHVRTIECREVKILEETDNFKSFGKHRICGVWDLSSMFITCAVSVKRSEYINCGGCNLQFKGWGMEDTFLGTCLIVRGNYIIPIFSTGVFHVEHSARSGNEAQKIAEFNKNVLVYLDLISQHADKVIKNLHD